MQRTIECPSGLTGIVTHLRTEDAACLADARAIRTGKAADQIISACWKETHEPGPYSTNGATSIDWGHVLACDRTYAVLMIRCCTHGTSEELDMKCQQCNKKFVWDLPLDKLPVYKLPDASRAKIKARDNSFPATTSDGTKLLFRLVTGHDQLRASKLAREAGSDVIQVALKTRLIEVSGVDKKELDAWIADLSYGEAQGLIDQFDAADGGIDTAFDVYCPRCAFEWEVDLPLDLGRMFNLKKGNRRRKGLTIVRSEDT